MDDLASNLALETEVQTDKAVLQACAVDGVEPRMVVTPASVQEAAHVVAEVRRNGLQLLPRGGGTRLHLGGVPQHIDIVLNTTRLSRLLEHEAPDLTCRVEAGITLAELQRQLAQKGQQLALDPPDEEQTTIGGLLASNASGPRRLRYGTARDLVIGLRTIQPNGEISQSGGRVVKNVAGYDLNKLYIGSFGTLGVIVEANFKLHPLPPAERTLLLAYSEVEEAMQTVSALLRSPLGPTAIELLDRGAMNRLLRRAGFQLPAQGYALAIHYEGNIRVINRQIDDTYLLARQYNALIGDELEEKEQLAFWKSIRQLLSEKFTCAVSLPIADVARYFQLIEAVSQRHNLETATIAHAGNGILFIEIEGIAEPMSDNDQQRLAEAVEALRLSARELRGHLIVERCPTSFKHRVDVWGATNKDFALMQRLKQQLDPDGTFVKGRFLGGL
ncbi:glycolate oxidase FAD binding subunit [Thermosporothrix hazakensis]|jgi:glycolate oxidase FAD binding subunit|uniref:Glycolate oxidase FAD binding subunit n=1 Tax=Thermosporothrix hazakensis TaxID=644383 RepID=A0A326U1H4_THEHA|nr:FAD-binding oxidoreductase [Thermosporothrix hazakensis]PZW24821.1 glycolate oxidase FAD binding subunit [Thermosporothrix hazakensis]GCE46489.1 FAD-linked oxidase [Thermosporothrix hazakensis]